MRTIIVATDFSPAALNAVNYAADMAMAVNAGLLLLHIYQVPVSYSEVPMSLNLDEIRDCAENDIKEIKDQLVNNKAGKLNVETAVRMGVFFHELKTVCESVMPYAVVMGSQGKTAAERLFFGGHTVYAMKHLMWPLITVPPEAKFSSVKKIGLACDFDHVIDTTPIHEIKKLVKDFDAKLHVLNTGSSKVFNPDIVFESGMLQEMLSGISPEYHFISSENTDEGIMDFAEKNNIDLLVVLPKRHDLLNNLTHKSHTKQFVLHSHVPVMALHQ